MKKIILALLILMLVFQTQAQECDENSGCPIERYGSIGVQEIPGTEFRQMVVYRGENTGGNQGHPLAFYPVISTDAYKLNITEVKINLTSTTGERTYTESFNGKVELENPRIYFELLMTERQDYLSFNPNGFIQLSEFSEVVPGAYLLNMSFELEARQGKYNIEYRRLLDFNHDENTNPPDPEIPAKYTSTTLRDNLSELNQEFVETFDSGDYGRDFNLHFGDAPYIQPSLNRGPTTMGEIGMKMPIPFLDSSGPKVNYVWVADYE
jgi:hypothetical protein